LRVLDQQIATLQRQVVAHFGRHPDAEVLASQPGLGQVLGARVLAEFGDDPNRYATAKARKNYPGTHPITRRSGKTRLVAARSIHNDRLIDALMTQAFAALSASPGARASDDQLRARGAGHNAALRQLATDSWGSCTAASRPAPATTRPPPGRITPRRSLLDTYSSWDVSPQGGRSLEPVGVERMQGSGVL
jgi:transposase